MPISRNPGSNASNPTGQVSETQSMENHHDLVTHHTMNVTQRMQLPNEWQDSETPSGAQS